MHKSRCNHTMVLWKEGLLVTGMCVCIICIKTLNIILMATIVCQTESALMYGLDHGLAREVSTTRPPGTWASPSFPLWQSVYLEHYGNC